MPKRKNQPKNAKVSKISFKSNSSNRITASFEYIGNKQKRCGLNAHPHRKTLSVGTKAFSLPPHWFYISKVQTNHETHKQ